MTLLNSVAFVCDPNVDISITVVSTCIDRTTLWSQLISTKYLNITFLLTTIHEGITQFCDSIIFKHTLYHCIGENLVWPPKLWQSSKMGINLWLLNDIIDACKSFNRKLCYNYYNSCCFSALSKHAANFRCQSQNAHYNFNLLECLFSGGYNFVELKSIIIMIFGHI